MTLDAQENRHLAALAQRLIEGMTAVEAATEKKLHTNQPVKSVVLASGPNPMVAGIDAPRRLSAIQQHNLLELARLRDEPFVAQVLVEDASGARQRFYFSRTISLSVVPGLDGQLVSYGAPLGRLAEYSPGSEVTVQLPAGRATFTILERVQLRPSKTREGWDGLEDRVAFESRLVTLKSLRQFLASLAAPEAESGDSLAEILAKVGADARVREGIRRQVIARMSLRDQPIVDQYQGEIFRLPLNRRLMLTGPPGTGKTTTLIRRLVQKRNADDVGEDERALVAPERLGEYFHPENWIMFSPTELLKLYLKEAFAQAGVAASDERVRVWTDERRRLARDVFRILRSERGGRFTLDDAVDALKDQSATSLMALADAFAAFFREHVVAQYMAAFDALGRNAEPALLQIVTTMRRRLGDQGILFDSLFEMVEFHEQLSEHVRQLAETTRQAIRELLNERLARNPTFLDDLAKVLDTIEGDAGPEDDDEEESEGEPDDEPLAEARDRRVAAIAAFRRAIFGLARALTEGRQVSSTSVSGRVLSWLGPSAPNEATLRPLGLTLTTLRRVRFLSSTHRNLIDRVPAIYRRFRRAMIRDEAWYRSEASAAIDRNRAMGAEVDVMLLFMLRHGRQFLLRGLGLGRGLQEDTRVATLEALKAQYVTQVLVDEATDFSPVQIACMLELAHPLFRSCFACGDVRQRVTPWGIRRLDELAWVTPDFEAREIVIGYRQSRRLAELANAVARLSGGDVQPIEVPDHIDDPDVPPLLLENVRDAGLARWLSERIREVERALGLTPSVAIFVDGDERIDPLVSALRPLLTEHNLDVVGCKEGRIVGGDYQIRVFDIQYIKGLEFEVAFFTGVDGVMRRYEDLAYNLLFVGITRAATYLGITCEGPLPEGLEAVRSHFRTDGTW